MQINYDRIKNEVDKTRRIMRAQEELAKFTPDNPPYLSDVYLNLDEGGQAILIALEEQENLRGQQPFKWKIEVIKDEWGNVPQPGEKLIRAIPKNRKNRDGVPVGSREFNNAMVRGSYADEFEDRIEYVIDDKGCIECTFSDAGYYLFNWGIHGKTRRGMCNKREYSGEPCKAPNGDKIHVHYWRYAEMDKDMYAALPVRKPEETKKRGSK